MEKKIPPLTRNERVSDCWCTLCKSPVFNLGILGHSGICELADEAVLKKVKTYMLTLTLTSSNYYMSPLSLSTCFPTDVLRHFMYSLPNPSESERPFSPLEEPVLRARGTELNGFLCFATGTARHWLRRLGDLKARYHWLWAVGAGVVDTVGERDGDRQWKGGGWRIFYRRPVLTSITLAFFKSMCSAHSSCGIKSPTISKF
jgi:hypothetical protein